jgi:hypothetical protein
VVEDDDLLLDDDDTPMTSISATKCLRTTTDDAVSFDDLGDVARG